ncbi:MAG: endonuclease V [Candidatus Erginobacter occultus]|nr:endonuclease V [Candidatus Erginobacter occultus]
MKNIGVLLKAALDVHYGCSGATAACVVFESWENSSPAEVHRAVIPEAAGYRAGRFFERELPGLQAVLEAAGREFESIVIDGYVHLRGGAGKGLGQHLWEALGCESEVVGVAKNPLKIAERFVPILRGRSIKPLFVSAAGCPLASARKAVLSMHGAYRIPTLLRLADRYARWDGE